MFEVGSIVKIVKIIKAEAEDDAEISILESNYIGKIGKISRISSSVGRPYCYEIKLLERNLISLFRIEELSALNDKEMKSVLPYLI